MTIEQIAEAFNAEIVSEPEDVEVELGASAANGQSDKPPSPPSPIKAEPSGAKVLNLIRAIEGSATDEPSPVDLDKLFAREREVVPDLITFRGASYAKHREVIRVTGDPGTGKSYFLLDITVAMVLDRAVAGMDVAPVDKVLWIDEEGDEGMLEERLSMLGAPGVLDPKRFRYYLNEGFYLDDRSDRERLFNIMGEFEPAVVVVDSFGSIHRMDENSKSEMRRLYNDAIKPMSRLLGATVFLIDHTNKSTGGKLDKRVSGSHDKSATVDRNWFLLGSGDGRFRFQHGKTRRQKQPPTLRIRQDIVGGAFRHAMEGIE